MSTPLRLANTEEPNPRTKQWTFRLPPELIRELKELAEKDRRPLNQYVTLVLEDAVKREKKAK